MDDLRYPVGKFAPRAAVGEADRRALIDAIAALPGALSDAVWDLTDAQLDTPYRPGGWTVRQVVHHVADSHVNAYVRTRLALTEETPLVKTYEEAAWAELADARRLPVEVSLALLEALHRRWVALLEALDPAAFRRRVRHPELGELDLDVLLQLYAWHGRHHTAHVTALRDRLGWTRTAIEPAAPDDSRAVIELVTACGLPTAGVLEALPHMVVARRNGRIVATAAVEPHGEAVLLRSVAVDASSRGQGLGCRIVTRALERAARRGARAAYLLTETADAFFARLGFVPVERSAVPDGVRASVEFASACPRTARAMYRPLR
ncbi:MAG TPA: putative metal-dependent hydrolase [Vicinamibacterales bacterium]|nr:putative metal-dependent hydrolase [Vicinamibacterales bacterium]